MVAMDSLAIVMIEASYAEKLTYILVLWKVIEASYEKCDKKVGLNYLLQPHILIL